VIGSEAQSAKLVGHRGRQWFSSASKRLGLWLSALMLPYTRAELPGWDSLLHHFGLGWRAGLKPELKALPVARVRGKTHGYLMRLDRSDWAQRLTYFCGRRCKIGLSRYLRRTS
jgi:hypothetical protein